MNRVLLCCFACAVGLLLSAEPARAQNNVIQVERVEVEGTIQKVAPQGITIRTAIGDYFADVMNQGISIGPAQVEIRGHESPEFLRPRMYVRFEAELDARRRVKSKVSELTLIALNDQPAASPRIGGPMPVVPQNPLMRPGFILLETLEEADEAGTRGGSTIPKSGKYAVVGQVVSPVRRGTVAVAVPDGREIKTVKVLLEDDAKVEIFLTDIRYAERGDKVTATGEMPVGANVRQFWATRVHIARGGPDEDDAANSADVANPGKHVEFGELGKRAERERKKTAEGIILKIN